jgi:hypothetical protein
VAGVQPDGDHAGVRRARRLSRARRRHGASGRLAARLQGLAAARRRLPPAGRAAPPRARKARHGQALGVEQRELHGGARLAAPAASMAWARQSSTASRPPTMSRPVGGGVVVGRGSIRGGQGRVEGRAQPLAVQGEPAGAHVLVQGAAGRRHPWPSPPVTRAQRPRASAKRVRTATQATPAAHDRRLQRRRARRPSQAARRPAAAGRRGEDQQVEAAAEVVEQVVVGPRRTLRGGAPRAGQRGKAGIVVGAVVQHRVGVLRAGAVAGAAAARRRPA